MPQLGQEPRAGLGRPGPGCARRAPGRIHRPVLPARRARRGGGHPQSAGARPPADRHRQQAGQPLASPVRAALGRPVQLLRQRPRLGPDVRADLPVLPLLGAGVPQPAPLAGQSAPRRRHRLPAVWQCVLALPRPGAAFGPRLFFSQVESCDNLIFHRRAAVDNLGARLLDANRTIGQPDKLTVIFGRKVTRRYRGQLQTVIDDRHLPNPLIRSHYGHGFIKQYVRDHLLLRTEATTNDVRDYAVPKAIDHLPALRQKQATIVDAYLDIQQDILETFVDHGELQQLRQPTVLPSGERIPGLKLDHPRQLAVMQALVRFTHVAAGSTFHMAELHEPVAAALGQSTSHYRLSSLRYDVSKLRAKGLIEKLPHSRRYRLLSHGYRLCLVFLKFFERLYAPLTAGLVRPLLAETQIPPHKLSQLDRLYQRVTQALDHLVSAVGLKAA